MENNKILSAAYLDILFDGRNKAYGAYQLRKSYNKRVATALVVTGSFILLVFAGSALGNVLNKKDIARVPVEDSVRLVEVEIVKPIEPPIMPPPKQIVEPPKVKLQQFTAPDIKPDDEVKPNEEPPAVEDLTDAKISTITQDGEKFTDVVAPPLETGSSDVTVPKAPAKDYDQIFIKVEEEAIFPGGAAGWKRYLERYLQYPEAAAENETQGVVQVEMVVNKLGKITEVRALNGYATLLPFCSAGFQSGPCFITRTASSASPFPGSFRALTSVILPNLFTTISTCTTPCATWNATCNTPKQQRKMKRRE